MKYFWLSLLGLIGIFGGLFLYQNQSRTLSVDQNGLQVSFDLGVWGIGSSSMSFVSLTLIIFVLGTLFGLTVPKMYKDIVSK